ncbi:MAG: 50S ribosomal protein L4 [Microscillaceae bacterium]|nr:50S ribosomal protein L4 [Microscillaceae bacterium]MDW8461838.1 50S ribosomal protein L4 [Cytophagales bacterium]
MELTVFDINGKETNRTVTLSEAIYNITPNDHAVYLDVKQYLANQRQGTHKSKEKSEVAGSTRKIKRQKGTGGARAGSIKSPIFIGGGRVFGPKPRDYSFKLNKKVKDLARRSALTYKAKEAQITVVEDFSFEKPKTKDFLKFLQNFSLENTKTLLLLPENNRTIYLSSRNLQKAHVLPYNEINTYAILNAERLIITESSIAKIENFFNKFNK